MTALAQYTLFKQRGMDSPIGREALHMISSFFWKKLAVRAGVAGWLPSVKRMLGGAERCLPYLSDRALALPVAELLDPAWFPDVQAPDSINLALASPRCDVPLGSLRSMNDRRPLGALGLPELRNAIVERSGRRRTPDPATEVVITHGAAGAFAATLDTFVNPGDRVVLFAPGSPIFDLGARHRRARIRWVKTWIEDGKTRFDLEAFAAAMKGARLLAFSDPVNPTGGLFAAEDLEQIAWWAKKHDVLLFQDESFAHFRYQPPQNHLADFPNSDERLLSAGGVSKTYGLNGARVGWLIGPRHLIQAMAATAAMAAPFVSPLCQQLALTALTNGQPMADLAREEFKGRRAYLHESLQGMGLLPAFPAAGFFLWISIEHLGVTGREFSRQLLGAKRVLVNPGEPFGPSGERHIRLSFALEEGRLREGIQRLSEFMEELRSRPDDQRRLNLPTDVPISAAA
jgi:aspartate/methionine/tyrosine aminotransferase